METDATLERVNHDAQLARAALNARNRAILEALRAGHSTRAVAVAAELSHTTVRLIGDEMRAEERRAKDRARRAAKKAKDSAA